MTSVERLHRPRHGDTVDADNIEVPRRRANAPGPARSDYDATDDRDPTRQGGGLDPAAGDRSGSAIPRGEAMPAKMEKTDVPGVYKRGGRYAYSYRKRGRQHWGSAATKAEARRRKRNAETDVERGEHRDACRLAFGEYARPWIEHYTGRTSRGFREPTRRWYREMLEQRLIPYFDVERGLRLAEVEPRDIKALIAWLATQPNPHKPGRLLSLATIRHHVAVVRALFADAVEEGVVRFNPSAGVRVAVDESAGTGREPADEKRALTRAELARLLAEIDERWRLFFELLAHTGLRIGEALELRWGTDVHFGARPTIRVRRQHSNGAVRPPKSRRGCRDIPLAPGLARRLWKAQGAEGELVFPSTVGTHLNRSNLYRDVLNPATARAGVPWVSFHTFRHTCASLLFAGGKNVKQVQVWLGHSDPGFTVRIYIHLMDDGLGDAAFLDELVKPGRGDDNAGVADEPDVADAAG